MPRLPGKGWFADSVLLFALSAYLIWPWFRLEYLDSWGSIESTFIGDSRMLRERGFNAQWQPNWYLGTRFDYIYPPALRYGTAAVSQWMGVSTARGYHIYTGTLFCLGIVGIYWLVRIATGWRIWAFLAALGVFLYSPTYLFLKHFEEGYRGLRYMGLRLGVLVRWGEGPHVSALSMLGFALAASWWGLRRGHRTALVLAAIFSAVVVANNFYGATALAIFFPLLVWAVALAENDAWVAARAAAIAALAYGLTACWLTPSYLRVTLENMRLVSQPGHTWSIVLEIAVLAVFAAISWRWARGRAERAWTVFVAGSLARISLYVLGHYYLGFRTLGEPERLCPEFDQFVVLAAVTAFAWLWMRGLRGKAAVIVLIWLSLLPVKGWVRRSWEFIPAAQGHQHLVEYQLTRWLHEHMPQSRAFVAGSVRFWYNAWFTLPEVSGGSDQGTLNPASTTAYYQVTGSDNPEVVLAWLRATGTDAVVLNSPHSQEIYHDFAHLETFAKLPVLFDNGAGDQIVGVPRRYPGLARIVDLAAHRAIGGGQPNVENYDHIAAYVRSIEDNSPRAAQWERLGPEAMRVTAEFAAGEALVIQETFDEGWRATDAAGRELRISQDMLHFLVIEPTAPGGHIITLRYHTPPEKQRGRALTAFTVGLCVFLLAWRKR
ncbi:MAG: hypothetical protein IT162_16335 [Bryobacterales bacterium]|nr:hypothetical protein [Bryobacterales bacterium]